MNNLTISNSSTSFVGLTQGELWIQLLFFYFTIGGWASVIGNMIILKVIAQQRSEFASRFFVIIASLSLTKTILALQTMVMSLYRIFRTLGYASFYQTRLNCIFIHFFMPPLFTVEVLILIILVVDRTLAIAFSNYYRNLTSKQILITCALTMILGSFIKLLMVFLMGGLNMLDVISCVNVASPVSENYQTLNAHIDLSLVALLLFCYICLMIDFRFRSAKVKSETAANALKRQKKVLITLRNVVLLHCAFTLTAKVILTIGSSFGGEIGIHIMAYGGIITQLDEFSNIIALMVSHPKLKAACLGGLIKYVNNAMTNHSIHPTMPTTSIQVQPTTSAWN